MVRTVQQIYDALIAEKNSMAALNALQPNIDSSQLLLSDVTTKSKVGKWRLELFVVAVAMWMHEVLWDENKAEVEEIAANAIPGTARWYRDQALKFQLGYELVYLNNKFQYSTVDVAAQIVQRAAIVETGGQVRIKVAKLVGVVVTPLTSLELDAFQAYINKVKFAGVNTAVLSREADKLKVAYTIYYDPLVLKPDGALISDAAIFPVQDAINYHISNLEFNGEFVLTSLTDAVQKASGIINPILTVAEAKYGGLPYGAVNVKYIPDAGHLIVDPDYPLTTQITYIPNV